MKIVKNKKTFCSSESMVSIFKQGRALCNMKAVLEAFSRYANVKQAELETHCHEFTPAIGPVSSAIRAKFPRFGSNESDRDESSCDKSPSIRKCNFINSFFATNDAPFAVR